MTVTFVDFAITVEGNLTAGDHLFELQNNGAEPHFLVLESVPDGTTDDDVTAMLMSESGPPASPAAGASPAEEQGPAFLSASQSIETKVWSPVTLAAGTYAAMCFFPTAGTGMAHAMNGMHTVFTVK